jgi:hypothetical protein
MGRPKARPMLCVKSHVKVNENPNPFWGAKGGVALISSLAGPEGCAGGCVPWMAAESQVGQPGADTADEPPRATVNLPLGQGLMGNQQVVA